MKSILYATALLISTQCSANTDAIAATVTWLQSWAPQTIQLTVQESVINFSGCKQKEYLAAFTQPLSKNVVLEMGLGYAKGVHSWGSYNQKVSLKKFTFIPRYQVSQDISIGFGVKAQSQTEFKTSQGFEFNLPKNTEWLVNTRTYGFATKHYWEWTASSQKWSRSNDLNGIFESGATNNMIGLSYNGYF